MMPIVYYVDDDAEPAEQKAEPVLLFGISFDKINVTFEVSSIKQIFQAFTM